MKYHIVLRIVGYSSSNIFDVTLRTLQRHMNVYQLLYASCNSCMHVGYQHRGLYPYPPFVPLPVITTLAIAYNRLRKRQFPVNISPITVQINS